MRALYLGCIALLCLAFAAQDGGQVQASVSKPTTSLQETIAALANTQETLKSILAAKHAAPRREVLIQTRTNARDDDGDDDSTDVVADDSVTSSETEKAETSSDSDSDSESSDSSSLSSSLDLGRFALGKIMKTREAARREAQAYREVSQTTQHHKQMIE